MRFGATLRSLCRPKPTHMPAVSESEERSYPATAGSTQRPRRPRPLTQLSNSGSLRAIPIPTRSARLAPEKRSR